METTAIVSAPLETRQTCRHCHCWQRLKGENILCDTNHDQLDLDDIGSVRQQEVAVAAPMKRMVIQLTIAAFFDTTRADGLGGGGDEGRRGEGDERK